MFQVLFVAFIITVPIIVINMIVGLAIKEVRTLQDKAELISLKKTIQSISNMPKSLFNKFNADIFKMFRSYSELDKRCLAAIRCRRFSIDQKISISFFQVHHGVRQTLFQPSQKVKHSRP